MFEFTIESVLVDVREDIENDRLEVITVAGENTLSFYTPNLESYDKEEIENVKLFLDCPVTIKGCFINGERIISHIKIDVEGLHVGISRRKTK